MSTSISGPPKTPSGVQSAHLQLARAVGFSGQVVGGLATHPVNDGERFYAVGSTVVHEKEGQYSFLRGHDNDITCMAVSASCRFLATGQTGRNPDVLLRDGATGEILYRLSEHDDGLQCLAFTEDERLLVSIGRERAQQKIFVWDTSSGCIVSSTVMPAPAVTVAWAPAGPNYSFATAGPNNILIWSLDPYTGKMWPEKCSMGSVIRSYTSLLFSTDGRDTLYAGTESGEVTMFAISDRLLSTVIPVCSGGVAIVAAHPLQPGLLLAGGGDGTLSVVVPGERCEGPKAPMVGMVTSISPMASGGRVMVGTAECFFYEVDLATMQSTMVQEAHAAGITAVSYAPDSDRFASTSFDRSVRVFGADDLAVVPKVLQPKTSEEATCVVLTEGMLFSGWRDGVLRCHSASPSELMAHQLWEIHDAHPGGVTALALTHNGRLVVSGGQRGEVRVWDFRSREMVAHLKQHLGPVTALAVFDDDMHVVSCSADRTLICWDLSTEKRLSCHTQRMGGISCLWLCPDQVQIITGGQEKRVSFWDIREPQPLQVVEDAHALEVTSLALAPSGRIFATGGGDAMVRLWDFQSGHLLVESAGHCKSVTGVAFSPDEQKLVSVGADGMVMVWHVSVEEGG